MWAQLTVLYLTISTSLWKINLTILERNYSKKCQRSITVLSMFSCTDMLLKHQKEEYTIQLEKGKILPFIQNYKPLSDQENNAMIKYIQKHLRKGFIRPSSSAAAAPVLLVKKLGKRLCFCVDYYVLNAVTIKNWYFIPFINKTFIKLAHAVCFTKLNIIAAFNKMRMKEEQNWITAFNTRHGQFEYLVMPFGLYNAPETF